MKLSKLKRICSEFGNDAFCSLSFNCNNSTTGSVEEFPYVYAINTDLKNINIGFTQTPEYSDILDDDFEPGVLTLAKLSHIIEPYSNDFNVIFNAAIETTGSLNIENVSFSFSKEFLNYYLFGFLDNNTNIFLVGEVNKDRFADISNTILVLRKVYYKNTFANNKYDRNSETLNILPSNPNNDNSYECAILQYTVSFNSSDELDNPVYDNIRIIRNTKNKDIFNPIVKLLFERTDDGDKFLHHSVDSVINYLKTLNVIQVNADGDDNIDTILNIDTLETIQTDIDNYLQQAKIDLLTLKNRISFSDISTNILDDGIHKNFLTDNIETPASYYVETKENFETHINETITSIENTITSNITPSGVLITAFTGSIGKLIKDNFNATYTVSGSEQTITQICKNSANTELKHDSSVYYLFENINYIVSYDEGVRNSKMYFNMLNTIDLTNKLKLGNNIIYQYADNTSGDSDKGKKLNFSAKNVLNKISKFTHYFYDDMDLGAIILDTNTDVPLVSAHTLDGNVLFYDYEDKLKEIYIPNCITSLGSGLFSSCTELTSLELPKYLTNIGEDVFPRYDETKTPITFSYAKNHINSRSWLDNQFTGTYSYYAPNVNGYNTLLFYPMTPTSDKVDISTQGFVDIDIVSVGKQSILIDSTATMSLTLDSTTEYIDNDAFIGDSSISGMLTIDATDSPLWYFNIPSHKEKFANIDLQLNTLSPVCLHYESGANHTYAYTNETFRDVQRNALSRIFKTAEPENLDDLIELQDSSPKISVTNIDDIHLIGGCKLLNNEIRFIKRTNLTNDTISLVITPQSDPNFKYSGEYEFNRTVRINETLNNSYYYAEYTLKDASVDVSKFSNASRRVLITDPKYALGELADTLKTIYVKLDNNGFFESTSFDYYASTGDSPLTPVIDGNFKVKKNNAGSIDEYQLLYNFLTTTNLDIKQFALRNNGVNYNVFKETIKSFNENCANIESNFINTNGLQYRTKTDSKILDNINIFPLFFTTDSTYNVNIKTFLKTTDQLYSIQLSDIKALSEIGISKLLLNDKFNPRLIEFPESINRFYDCPIIIDETYDTDELTIRFWSNFEDIITKKTLLDIDAIQKQIRTVSTQYSTQSNFTFSAPAAGSFTNPTFGVNNSIGTAVSPTVGSLGQTSIPTTTLGFTQNNNVLCICTNSDSLEKLIYINSEKLKTLRIQVKDGENYEHIYNFFKTNINKLVHINTSNNHTLNIIVETFVHTDDFETKIATYNFYNI